MRIPFLSNWQDKRQEESQRSWERHLDRLRRKDAAADDLIVAHEHRQMNDEMLLDDEPRYWEEEVRLEYIPMYRGFFVAAGLFPVRDFIEE